MSNRHHRRHHFLFTTLLRITTGCAKIRGDVLADGSVVLSRGGRFTGGNLPPVLNPAPVAHDGLTTLADEYCVRFGPELLFDILYHQRAVDVSAERQKFFDWISERL